MDKKELKNVVGAALQSKGFVRRNDTWYLDSEFSIALVNLQASSFSHRYYVNLACWIKVLGDERYPRHNRCHVNIRLESAYPQQREQLGELLDFENSAIDSDVRRTKLERAVGELIVPYVFDTFLDFDSLKAAHKTGRLENAALMRVAREYLEN